MKTVMDKRQEDLLPLCRSRADGAILWIDEASGRIVDYASRPELRTKAEDPVMAVSSRRRTREVGSVFIDLVGPQPPSPTIASQGRVERLLLSRRPLPLLPAKGGES